MERSIGEFLKCATEYMKLQGGDTILCPCSKCQNLRREDVGEVELHLIKNGFMRCYTRWIWHGELAERSAEAIGTSRVENIKNVVNENIENVMDENVENNIIELDEIMSDVENDCAYIPEILSDLFLQESNVPLYPDCTKYSKLSAVFKLYNLKVKSGWSDKSFTSLFKLLGDMLPEKNVLPDSTYHVKKLLCPLSMKVERIHACSNDCILYRKEYTNLHRCPTCNASRYKSRNDDENDDGKKKSPVKVIWYLPIIPRFRRLFLNSKDAKLLKWHHYSRKKDGKLRHPADTGEWRNIGRRFATFEDEPRNLRLGLCMGEMNPYGNMDSRHSTWPVLLCVYNFPPWLCMKRNYMMMPLLISGPKKPGYDIDVYLAPLMDDLQKLWKEGVQMYDADLKEHFSLRAMIFCTISDYPTLGNLSGYNNKGAKACVICQEDTHSIHLHNHKKNVYMGHRRYLLLRHDYRVWTSEFDGTEEKEKSRQPATVRKIYEVVKDITVQFGKKSNNNSLKNSIWKKKSIFWDLPYWQHLEIRHCLDRMSIVNNVAESIIGLLLNIPGKTKDGIKTRKDMFELEMRPELAPVEGDTRAYLPAASWTLTKKQKESLLGCLKDIKVPTIYCSNISAKVSMKKMKLIGMKSHDYHVLLTLLLPIAIRGILKPDVRNTITKLCFFFNSICSKEIDLEKLVKLQSDLVQTICELEMYFPPSFFDIMVHLIIHLMRDIRFLGPMFLHDMYPFERDMGDLKGLCQSRSRPEGSIVEGYIGKEVINFYNEHMPGLESIGRSKRVHEDRLQGFGKKGSVTKVVDDDLLEKAHFKVLSETTKVSPYMEEHLAELRKQNQSGHPHWVTKEHNKKFTQWFKDKLKGSNNETLRLLAKGPSLNVITHQCFDINGFTWYTKKQDQKSTVQNSGVIIEVVPPGGGKPKSYYGRIEEIWELDYLRFKIPLFLCEWFDPDDVKVETPIKFTTVDMNRLSYRDEPFIIANKQVKQVFYVVDPADKKRHVVLSGKQRIVSVGDVTHEQEYDNLEEVLSFSSDIESDPVKKSDKPPYKGDHDEGVWVKIRK